MKNSSKFLLAAVLVLLASLTAYNMALRTEYRLGTYKDPLHGYVDLGFKNFTTIAVPASGVVGVKIVPGPFRVRLDPRATEYVHLSQQGNQLVITADFPNTRRFFGPAAAVIISCPQLVTLATDAVYRVQGKQVVGNNFWNAEQVLVQGFQQDSLTVRSDRGSRVELTGNHLAYLGATAGPSLGSHTQMQLNADNRIAAADLTLGHQSELILNSLAIPTLRYHVADSAKVTLGGAALRSLSQN